MDIKDQEIQDLVNTVIDLKREIKELELENANLTRVILKLKINL